MQKTYELMIYGAVATLYFYRADIVAVRGPQTPDDFRKRNEAVVKRVFDEILSLFNYELSCEQIDRAIVAYLMPGSSTAQPVATPRPS